MTKNEINKTDRDIIDLPMNDNQWKELIFFRLIWQLAFNLALIPGIVIFNFLFVFMFSTRIPVGVFLQIILINVIYFGLSLPKIIKITKVVKKLNKADIAFYPDFIAINPLLIDLHMESPLMGKSMNKIYNNLKSGKHIKIEWKNIARIETDFNTVTHGHDIESFTYIFKLHQSIKGMKTIILNRKFFLNHENQFEKLIHKYSGIKVERNAKTLVEHHRQTSIILLISVGLVILFAVAEMLGYDLRYMLKDLIQN